MKGGFEGPGEVVRRRASLLVAALLVVGAATAMTSAGVPGWATLVEQGLAMTLLVAFAVNAWRERRSGRVRADGQGVWLDGARVVSRRRITSAYLLSFEAPVVRIACRLALPFDVRLEDDDAARALLDALGFGIGQSIATFRVFYGGRRHRLALLGPTWVGASTLGGFAAATTHRIGMLSALLLTSGIVGLLLATAGALLFARVEVGSDGVLVRRVGRRRFIPYSALAGASAEGQDAVLALHSGERIRVSMGGSMEQLESRDAMVLRIEEANAASAPGYGVESAAAIVAPGGRPVDRWMRELRASSRARDYRQAALEDERLWELLHDGSVPAATRAGAAVALAASPDGETHARLRVAAESCAEPMLRVALSRVADGADESDLEEALAPLVEADAAKRDAS